MKINLFRLCSGLKVIGYFMILLVAAIISVSYYAVVIATWGPKLNHGGVHSFLAFFIIVMFHILAGSSLTLSQNIEPKAFTSTQTSGGGERRPQVRYCSRCQNGKPPRCHHCSVCQRCVLKMDYHCVWVVNCVGARNYKFFLLFLIVYHVAVLNLAFALSLLCFVVMHASLLSSNTTTVEVHEKRGAIRWKYDLGRKKNFEQAVFGTKKALRLLPLFSKEDLDNVPALRGLEFPILSDTDA